MKLPLGAGRDFLRVFLFFFSSLPPCKLALSTVVKIPLEVGVAPFFPFFSFFGLCGSGKL